MRCTHIVTLLAALIFALAACVAKSTDARAAALVAGALLFALFLKNTGRKYHE